MFSDVSMFYADTSRGADHKITTENWADKFENCSSSASFKLVPWSYFNTILSIFGRVWSMGYVHCWKTYAGWWLTEMSREWGCLPAPETGAGICKPMQVLLMLILSSNCEIVKIKCSFALLLQMYWFMKWETDTWLGGCWSVCWTHL